jgi:hypothetical protein
LRPQRACPLGRKRAKVFPDRTLPNLKKSTVRLPQPLLARIRGYCVDGYGREKSRNSFANEMAGRSEEVTPRCLDEMAARAGIEPHVRFLEACADALRSETTKTSNAHELSTLAKILSAWPKLSGEFRTALQEMTLSVAARL